jgi:hypothetical protein
MVGWNSNIYLSEDFKNLVGQKPYVLVEEIQSDLLQKGYVKPKDSFEAAFAETVKRFNTESEFTFDEAYGDITKDVKKTFKELDKLGEVEEPQRLKSVTSPDNYVFSRLKEERLIKKVKDRFWENQGEPGYVTFEELKDYIDKQGTNDQELWNFTIGLERERRLNDWFTFKFIDEKSGKIYDDFVADWDNPTFANLLDDFTEYMKDFGLDKDSILAKYENDIDDFYDKQKSVFRKSGLGGDFTSEEFFNIYDSYKFNSRIIDPIDDVALPPIRKNKQAVEEGLKAIIAKAAKDGVTKIVIPPVEKIAEARGRTVDPTDKGDRFYRTYVTDLNQVLDELSENYPVTVHRDIELPYKENRKSVDDVLNEYGVWNPDDDVVDADFADPQDMETMLGDALRQQNQERFNALNLNLNDPSLYVVDNPVEGTVIDISKLVEDYKVEEPRQYAEGGAVGNMNQQMSFAFADGGLRDDGMRQDPVSGNEVPSGSLANEVRDDIPAQLSEGEYVVPADVVRYYGVKFFEDLRQEAKTGLQDMEMNGRIGGEPVLESGPEGNEDLTPEELAAIQEMMGMYRGGAVGGFAEGGLQTDQDILTAGQQAQQRQFTGFPLGATIFPRADSGQIESVPVTPTITVEETAESCAAKGMDYDPATKTCVPRAVAPTASDNNNDDSRVEPPKWYEKYDYADTNKLVSQSLTTLGVNSDTEEKETQNTLQKIVSSIGQGIGNMLEGNTLGGIIRQQKVAEVAANAQLLRAQGKIKEAEMLENAIDGYRTKHDIEPGGFFDSTKTLAKQLADKYSDLGFDEENEVIIRPGSVIDPARREAIDKSRQSEAEKARIAAEKAAEARREEARRAQQQTTIQQIQQSNQDDSPTYGYDPKNTSSTAPASASSTYKFSVKSPGNTSTSGGAASASYKKQEDSNFGLLNKGGLMASKPKTQTKRQYKKGGLAGKK